MPRRSKRPALLQDRRAEIALGVALYVAASWLVWDAYEGRGKPRPFGARLAPMP
jgi:hypothetical protein